MKRRKKRQRQLNDNLVKIMSEKKRIWTSVCTGKSQSWPSGTGDSVPPRPRAVSVVFEAESSSGSVPATYSVQPPSTCLCWDRVPSPTARALSDSFSSISHAAPVNELRSCLNSSASFDSPVYLPLASLRPSPLISPRAQALVELIQGILCASWTTTSGVLGIKGALTAACC